MISLSQYVASRPMISSYICEGGASGHMSQIIDYSDLTLKDLKNIIYDLFSGKISATEKLDGLNIQASMNGGTVIFARNKSDMNKRLNGGMSLEELAEKYKGRGAVYDAFVNSGKVIQKVFKVMNTQFFNPTSNTRRWVNCECILPGTTNIMPYASGRVYFHDIWTYVNIENEWIKKDVSKDGIEDLRGAIEKLDNANQAMITPEVFIDQNEQGHQARDKFIKAIDKIWRDARLTEKDTIDAYKRTRYDEWIKKYASWAASDEDANTSLYNRLINDNITIKLTELKKIYKEYISQLNWLLDKKTSKDLYEYVLMDLDSVFLELTNNLLKLVKNIANAGLENKVTSQLQKELEDTVKAIQDDPDTSEYAKTTLIHQLDRIRRADGTLNPLEGIVFTWNGRTMKCTGSFGPLNQILGSLKYSKQ